MTFDAKLWNKDYFQEENSTRDGRKELERKKKESCTNKTETNSPITKKGRKGRGRPRKERKPDKKHFPGSDSSTLPTRNSEDSNYLKKKDPGRFGANKRFADILFQRIREKSVPAADAFKILRSRINDLDFKEFEGEYRKYYLKESSSKLEKIQNNQTSPPKETAKLKNNLPNGSCNSQSILEKLGVIESRVQEIFDSHPVLDERERKRLNIIRQMLDKL